jgi:hypothetical protein
MHCDKFFITEISLKIWGWALKNFLSYIHFELEINIGSIFHCLNLVLKDQMPMTHLIYSGNFSSWHFPGGKTKSGACVIFIFPYKCACRVRAFDPAGSCVKQERRVLTARGKPQVHAPLSANPPLVIAATRYTIVVIIERAQLVLASAFSIYVRVRAFCFHSLSNHSRLGARSAFDWKN